MKGKVEMWNVRRGWGFIKGDDGVKYFAHHSDIKSCQSYKLLADNQIVEFDAINTNRGPHAVNITENVGNY